MCSQDIKQLRRSRRRERLNLATSFTSPPQATAHRTLATNLPRLHGPHDISSSATTRASQQQLPASTALPHTPSPPQNARVTLVTSAPTTSRPELYRSSVPPTAHYASPPLPSDASAAPREPLQYHSPLYSHHLTTTSVSHPQTMPPAEHLRYGSGCQPSASVPHSVVSTSSASHPYPHVTTSVAWRASNSPTSPNTPQVLPGPQYMPYMRSAPPGPAYYVYPPAPSQYVTHPAYYAPNYTYSTLPQHQPRPLHDLGADARPPQALQTPAMTLSHTPVPQSMPAGASQQQTPLMTVPLYVNMPQFPVYSQPLTPKKRRLQWTPELHSKFVKAVDQYGIDDAVPKLLLRAMNVPGLTRENVASHLQKYRENLRKKKQELDSSGNHVRTDGSPEDSEVHGERSRDKAREQKCKQNDMPIGSSSRTVRCDSSDISSSEQNSFHHQDGDVHTRDEPFPLPDQALKKRRFSESPT